MKITYIYPPLFKGFHPMATRMITENLLRNKNLEVYFSDIPVRTYTSRIHETIYEHIMAGATTKFSPAILSFLEQRYIVNNIFYVFMTHGYFDEYILKDFDTPYVLISVINFCDLIIVKHLLEKNKRVVVGGPLINIGLSPAFIRDFLHSMGIDRARLADDMIIVSGNIDLTTDLYAIIKDWKDADITRNTYGTLYECERDFLQEYYDDSSVTPVHFGFNNRCWYGKCKFCTYRGLPKMDFLEDVEDTKVVNNIHKLMIQFGSRDIRLIDSYYYVHRPQVQNILEQIKQYNITIYSGVTLLKRREYIEFVNKYVDCLLIGLESTSDFSLDQVDKGYTYQDVKSALDNVIRYLDKKISLELSVILDLPCKNVEDVKANYERILDIKQRLLHEGFNASVHMNTLSVFPNMELLYGRNGFLKRSDDPAEMVISSGKNYLIHLLRRAGMDRSLVLPSGSVMLDKDSSQRLYYGYISSDVPVIRYDIEGKVLPSDLNLVDENTIREILTRRP